MTSVFHSGLSKDFSLILNDADDYNVIIQVVPITKKNDMIMFEKPNITPTVFEMVLKFLYTGEVNLVDQSGEDIFGLLIASDELLLDELFKYVQDHLFEKHTSWMHSNFVLVLHFVFKLASCKKLQDYCLQSICTDPQPFINSKSFSSLDKDVLLGLLKRDDFQVEEIVIWNCLINWVIEQTPGLGSKNCNRTKWNQENFEELKKTLEQFISLIRFVEISPKDFFDKIRPYKAAIPNHIYEEIEEFYYKKTFPKSTNLIPRSRKFQIEIESQVIKPDLANVIAHWIERKDDVKLLLREKYKFELIYRSSQDGLTHQALRSKCNNQGSCLVLVKQPSTTKIYGGYNPLGFTSGSQSLVTNESFTFSFENDKDTTSMKISRVVKTNYAMWEHNGNGFNFGSTFYMIDQSIYLNYNGNYDGNVVANSSFNSNFVPSLIEVFKVIPNVSK
ncbi:10596_t:CDS:2 [Funneliformis mosseae]|uniref:10596_t:CDS:1 n=1 Tax=Funneliformis mosseae TaxID=27381 RepID=A0A9N9E9R1_FUNMO|nr:10596_t:CDS:2 [Funneliformis mosseae]